MSTATIPQFPDFKKIEVNDREGVEAHTHRFEPYSDFNFTSLWAWDTSNERQISELNGNLVVRFTDYSTHEAFFSFLGDKEIEHTARTLIDHAKEIGLAAELRLMPEVSVAAIRSSVLRVAEDPNNFDYIYSVPKLAALHGTEYMSKRSKVNKFSRENPSAKVEVIDLADVDAQKDVMNVVAVWERNKIDNNKTYEVEHERSAIQRLCQTADSHHLVVLGIFSEDVMLAFSVEEQLPNQYAISHFWKADTASIGIYDYLKREKAKHLETLGVEYLNFEQDLGSESLRANKMGYRPQLFLKKYVVDMP